MRSLSLILLQNLSKVEQISKCKINSETSRRYRHRPGFSGTHSSSSEHKSEHWEMRFHDVKRFLQNKGSSHQSEGIMGGNLWQGLNIWNAGELKEHRNAPISTRTQVRNRQFSVRNTNASSHWLHTESERASSRETSTTKGARMGLESQALLVEEETVGITGECHQEPKTTIMWLLGGHQIKNN